MDFLWISYGFLMDFLRGDLLIETGATGLFYQVVIIDPYCFKGCCDFFSI